MNYIRLIRPKQWVKNTLVIAPLIFSGELIFDQIYIALYSTFIFIITSSCIYIFNDIRDIDYDKNHKKNSLRPIASGEISQNKAYFFLIALFFLDIIVIYFCKISLSGIGFLAVYFIFNLLYSLGLKNIPLLEMFILSSGFVIRLLFGAEETSIVLSPWIILCSGMFVLMITVGKRRGDFMQSTTSQSNLRQSLIGYNLKYLDQINTLLASITIMSYLLYCMSEHAYLTIGPSVIWTAPLVIFSILRYLQLISVENSGDDPTSMLLGDKVSLILFLLWLLSMVSIIYY